MANKEESIESWTRNLAEYRNDGRHDAERGEFDLPHYFTDNDPQYLDENQAYKDGFMSRRKELGDAFNWA